MEDTSAVRDMFIFYQLYEILKTYFRGVNNTLKEHLYIEPLLKELADYEYGVKMIHSCYTTL